MLVNCRRICALCFCLKQDFKEKPGQLAHIDRNPDNNDPDNAAFLCTEHHDRYDSPSRQTKGYTPDELKAYQARVWAYVQSLDAGVKKDTYEPGAQFSYRAGVSLEVYNRRLPIYHLTMQFVRDVLKDLKPELQLILKFVADTDEAVFLFDNSIAEYLDNVFRRALRLNTLEFLRARVQTDERDAENFPALVQEETDLAMWFSEQPVEIRTRFVPFLRLA